MSARSSDQRLPARAHARAWAAFLLALPVSFALAQGEAGGAGAGPETRDVENTEPRSGPLPQAGPSLSDPRSGGAERDGVRDTAQPAPEPPAGAGGGVVLYDESLRGPVNDGPFGEVPFAPATPEPTPQRDPQTIARMLGEVSFVHRDRAMGMAESELRTGQALGQAIVTHSNLLTGEARTQLNDRILRMNQAESEFATAITSARAANEPRWEDLRRDVVARYSDYVAAIEEARAAAIRGGMRQQEPGRLLPSPGAP
jgi:hypothetical protein